MTITQIAITQNGNHMNYNTLDKMTPLTREYLEARGLHESSAIETGYRSQFTTTTEDYSYYLSLLSTSPLIDDLLERIENESFEVIISNRALDNRCWATIPTRIIVSTVEQFEMLLTMLDVELKLIGNDTRK